MLWLFLLFLFNVQRGKNILLTFRVIDCLSSYRNIRYIGNIIFWFYLLYLYSLQNEKFAWRVLYAEREFGKRKRVYCTSYLSKSTIQKPDRNFNPCCFDVTTISELIYQIHWRKDRTMQKQPQKETNCCWNEYSLIFLRYNISNKTKEPVEKRNSDFISRESDWILAKWTGTRPCPFVYAKGQKFSGAICFFFFYYELRFIRVRTGPGKRRRDFERQSKIVRASRKLIKWLLVFSRGGYEVSLVAVYCKEE